MLHALKYKIVVFFVNLIGPKFWHKKPTYDCIFTDNPTVFSEIFKTSVQIDSLKDWESQNTSTHLIEIDLREKEYKYFSWRFFVNKQTLKPTWVRNAEISLEPFNPTILEESKIIQEDQFY